MADNESLGMTDLW